MLDKAFVETSDYQALLRTQGFNFVVGRRGTGKTALYLRLSEDFRSDKRVFAHTLRPEEHHFLALVHALHTHGAHDYRQARPIVRLLWRISLLTVVAEDLCHHWKVKTSSEAMRLREHMDALELGASSSMLVRCTGVLKHPTLQNCSVTELPATIADAFKLTEIENLVVEALKSNRLRAVFLFDGLDEGWGADEVSTAVVGGLATALAGFRDMGTQIFGEMFVRDNVFRYLASLDSDYSRHIEGSALRLHWNVDSLLNLVASRLRVALNLESVESNVKVWNRFARRELKNREGFEACLKHTLYRPRDVLVLLNRAAVTAFREGRKDIIDSDIEAAANQISADRLTDLLKEYEGVFPGLGILIGMFKGESTPKPLREVRGDIDEFIETHPYDREESSDIAILGSSAQVIDALYGIGFLGVEEPSGAVRFRHDGALESISDESGDQRVAIHPCYWRSLGLSNADVDSDRLVDIHDDYDSPGNSELADLRKRRLGRLISQLPACERGSEGAAEFEGWVLQACKILFAGKLENCELHPCPDGVQRRDVVATNEAESGFWRRVLDDYGCRQVVIEVKNFADLDREDYRQALSYTGKQYGRIVFVIHRSEEEGLNNKARGWVKEMWDQHGVLIVTIPAKMVSRALGKVRNPKRKDYAESMLKRRLDTFERNYVSARHSRK